MTHFFASPWGQFWINGVVANLLASAVVAVLVIYIFRVPSFGLDLDYISSFVVEHGRSIPVLDLSVENKKRWLGFGVEEVNFGLFIPIDLASDKEFRLVTSRGMERWNIDLRGKQIFNIAGTPHYLFRGVVGLAVHPQSRTHFLRLGGDFPQGLKARIYYYFETPYGRYPLFLGLGERVQTAVDQRLPSEEVQF